MAKRATAKQAQKIRVPEEERELTLDDLKAELRRYEKRFGMTSEEFIKRWEAGEMEDNLVNNWWAHAVYDLKIATSELIVDDEGKVRPRALP